MANTPRKRTKRGFTHAAGLVATRIRQAGASRGFSETRLLTAWEEIVGPAIAAIAVPAKISYAKAGIGATLTLFAKGAHGPELQMQLDAIRARVNACYGYNAISRVRITQVDTGGFASPSVPYTHDAPEPAPLEPEQYGIDKVKSDALRVALESLGGHVLNRG